MNKYQNKYRIPSAGLQNWDYGAVGSYFVTICTQNREHFFGKIVRNEMILNAIGKKVEEEWLKTIALRPDMNLELGNFVVMPNHFRGRKKWVFGQRKKWGCNRIWLATPIP